jgi:response regulator of citrate/malate metabolism
MEVRSELNSPVQIMVILADPTKEEIIEAVQAGVNEFLATPFTQNTLESKLYAMAKRRKAPRAPSPFSVPMG